MLTIIVAFSTLFGCGVVSTVGSADCLTAIGHRLYDDSLDHDIIRAFVGPDNGGASYVAVYDIQSGTLQFYISSEASKMVGRLVSGDGLPHYQLWYDEEVDEASFIDSIEEATAAARPHYGVKYKREGSVCG